MVYLEAVLNLQAAQTYTPIYTHVHTHPYTHIIPMRITATCFAAKYPESVGCQFNRTWDHSKPIQCIRCIKGALRHIINMFGTKREHNKYSTTQTLQIHCEIIHCKISSRCGSFNYIAHGIILSMSSVYDASRKPSGISFTCSGPKKSTLKISIVKHCRITADWFAAKYPLGVGLSVI